MRPGGAPHHRPVRSSKVDDPPAQLVHTGPFRPAVPPSQTKQEGLPMRVRDLLAPGAPRLRLLAAEEELDRQVSGVMTTDLHDPGRYLHGGELVLTGMLWRTAPEDSERFVRTLASGGAVALAAGEAEVGPVPEDLVEACRRHRMPLLAVPDDIAFGAVAEFIGR